MRTCAYDGGGGSNFCHFGAYVLIINELIDFESKTMVFKSLNELAPPYLRSLFRKNSQSISYRLRNTSIDLRLPKKVQKTARNAFRLGV